MKTLKQVCAVLSMLLLMMGILAGFVPAEDPVTLRVWKYGSPQHEREYMVQKNGEFEQANPDITIEWAYQNWAERRTQVLAANKADNLPDIILSDSISIPEFERFGIIVPLNEVNQELVESWKPLFVE